jgi:hypothetical protein
MRRQLIALAALVLTPGFWLLTSAAQQLPSFEDFRRVDQARRLTGQLQTAELLSISQINANLIKRTAEQHSDDSTILWGAAELLSDWSSKRDLFEQTLHVGGTNVAVALRFACVAAKVQKFEIALSWLQYCQRKDADNMVPWLVEMWVQRQHKQPLEQSQPMGTWTTHFRDYSVEASRARIKLLKAAGYSAYAARRLGFSADSVALTMVRDMGKLPLDGAALPILRSAGKAMQENPPFLLDELVGQSLERSLLANRKDADTSPQVRFRVLEMDERRDAIKQLLGDMQSNTVDLATESQMVQYFDNVLTIGEEPAMRRLADVVRGKPSSQ